MQKLVAGFVFALVGGATLLASQDMPEMPGPQKEHEWLQQLVGEWETESEVNAGPDQPGQTFKGKESVRSIGGLWVMAEFSADMGMPFTGILTAGYDAEAKKYVGTWIDSMTSYMWHYNGAVDAAGKILTLETEGPSPMTPGKRCKFKESFEIKDKDHKVFTSTMQMEDGTWTTFMTTKYQRKK